MTFPATTDETDRSPAPAAATAFLASQLSACSQAIQEPQAMPVDVSSQTSVAHVCGEKQCTARELESKHCWGGGHLEANHYLLKRPSPCDRPSYSFGQSKCAHKQGRHL
ncbi:hypothetical protein V5799_030448 [Amblyomma americanum]|uniref:Uncharacterized protein n=1 Tax=Amblyomma americanum TaxID=6943 RepID=A0AAQ4ENA8_AMBAM